MAKEKIFPTQILLNLLYGLRLFLLVKFLGKKRIIKNKVIYNPYSTIISYYISKEKKDQNNFICPISLSQPCNAFKIL